MEEERLRWEEFVRIEGVKTAEEKRKRVYVRLVDGCMQSGFAKEIVQFSIGKPRLLFQNYGRK
jgi:hypothetical protein